MNYKSMKDDKIHVRINTSIKGEPARILLSLKQRGVIVSNTDAVIQGLLALHERVLKRDLEVAQLRTLKHAHQSDSRDMENR